jgi:hypothetical protein
VPRSSSSCERRRGRAAELKDAKLSKDSKAARRSMMYGMRMQMLENASYFALHERLVSFSPGKLYRAHPYSRLALSATPHWPAKR